MGLQSLILNRGGCLDSGSVGDELWWVGRRRLGLFRSLMIQSGLVSDRNGEVAQVKVVVFLSLMSLVGPVAQESKDGSATEPRWWGLWWINVIHSAVGRKRSITPMRLGGYSHRWVLSDQWWTGMIQSLTSRGGLVTDELVRIGHQWEEESRLLRGQYSSASDETDWLKSWCDQLAKSLMWPDCQSMMNWEGEVNDESRWFGLCWVRLIRLLMN